MSEVSRNEGIAIGSVDTIINILFKISFLVLLILPATLGTSAKLILIISLFVACYARPLRRDELFLFIFITIFNLFYLVYSLNKLNLIYDLSIRAFFSYQGVALATFALIWGASGIKKEDLFKLFIMGVSLYCLIKFLLTFVPYLGSLTALGPGFVIFSREQSLLRVATSNDLFLPFAIFFVLMRNNFNLDLKPYMSSLCLIIMVITSALTFTRYIWISAIAVILCYIFLYSKFKILDHNIYKHVIPILILLIIIVPIYCLSDIGTLKEYFSIRFSDVYSLHIKAEQARLLIASFADAPLLGAGNSAFIESYIRSERLPFIYETQWLAILYQFGIIGTVIISLLLLLPIYLLLRYVITNLKFPKICFMIFIMYALFLLSGFTNPNLFILNTSVIYFITYSVSSFCITKNNTGV